MPTIQKVLLLLCPFLFLSTLSIAQNNDPNPPQAEKTLIKYLGKTKPLRDLAPRPLTNKEKLEASKREELEEVPNFIGRRKPPKLNSNALPLGVDPVWQAAQSRGGGLVVEPELVIDGIDVDNSGSMSSGVPDCNGAIGANHFIEMVNATLFKVYSKDGVAQTAPLAANTLWNQFGARSGGDPIVLYDQGAQRWIITEFDPPGGTNSLLIAISDTDDPLGTWNAYQFITNRFPDYPKYAIWPNAYVVTTNEGSNDLSFYVIDRQAMLAGATNVSIQRLTVPDIFGVPGFFVITPVNWSGDMMPPDDTPPMVMRLNDDAWGAASTDRIDIFTVDNIDWDNANNTVLSGPFPVETAPFDTDACSTTDGALFSCIPQPNGLGIDGIPYVLMNQIQYRNFGASASVVLNFMVNASGASKRAGIRWCELRKPTGGSWSMYQEGTYAPAGDEHRFMGGIAIDARRNIGMGFSVSGPNTFPSLRFTGRRPSDPLGMMTVVEQEFTTGSGNINTSRFGDYASMNVDPVNGRTFWYTGEYVQSDGDWGTGIVAFEIARDTNDLAPISLVTPQNAPDLGASEEVKVVVENSGQDTQTAFDVGYIFEGQPAVIESVQMTLAPGATYEHTFGPRVNMNAIKAYDFKIFTRLDTDTNINNDTLFVVRNKLPQFDVAVSDIRNLDAQICADSAIVAVEITNEGTEVLNTIEITPNLNGTDLSPVIFTGSLASGESDVIELIIRNLSDGTNTLIVRAALGGGQVDQIATNNEQSKMFDVISTGITVSLELQLDRFADETSWILTDELGDTIEMGGPYAEEQERELIIEDWCLNADQCYTFTIMDSYGDGLNVQGDSLDGSYAIKDGLGRTLAAIRDIDFGFDEVSNFCATFVCLLKGNIDVTEESSPGAGDGVLMVDPFDGFPPFQYSINGGSLQSSNVFSGLASGNYTVLITDANQCVYTETVSLMTTNIHNIERGYSIVVRPNPTNGIFQVEATGLPLNDWLEIQVLSVDGKLVQHARLSPLGNRHSGWLSIEGEAPGVYFVRFKNNKINELLKLVKQ